MGAFRDHKFHGQGTYYHLADNYFKGDKYVGAFKDDKRHGQGTYTYANGGKYVGAYKDGKRHGQGIETFANGTSTLVRTRMISAVRVNSS